MRRVAVAAVIAVALCGCGGRNPEGDLLIRADRLFDGTRMIEPGAVLIRGDEILAVGTDVKADAERTIALGDATIMPGFIDLHVHVREPALVRAGVTTVRDLGSTIDLLAGATRPQPLRVLAAGPIVTAPGGYPIPVWGPSIALKVRGEARARAAVRDLVRRGADVIKIALEPANGWPMLTADEVRAIVEEAHAHDLIVTAHVTGRQGAEAALAGRVDELAHTPCGVGEGVPRKLATRGVEVVATLHALTLLRGTVFCPADPVDDARRLAAAGVELLYGTDAGLPGLSFGVDVTELRMLRRAGLAPAEVLAAATSRAGRQLGLAPLGTLAQGAPADMIGVPGDALQLRDDLAVPVMVIRAGRIVVGPRGQTPS
jgi:imidazolonepropionase-like amidohydrolase